VENQRYTEGRFGTNATLFLFGEYLMTPNPNHFGALWVRIGYDPARGVYVLVAGIQT
jgi:hypothetical protein